MAKDKWNNGQKTSTEPQLEEVDSTSAPVVEGTEPQLEDVEDNTQQDAEVVTVPTEKEYTDDTEQEKITENGEVVTQVTDTTDAEVTQVPGNVNLGTEQPVAEVIEAATMQEVNKEVEDIIRDINLTIEDKLTALSKLSNSKVSMLAKQLLYYVTNMDGRCVIRAQDGAVHNYHLLNALKTACSDTDPDTFNTLFNIINITFSVLSYGVFSELSLSRFVAEWSSSKEDLTAFKYLTNIISRLSTLDTRKANSKAINIKAGLNPEVTGFNTKLVENISRYYQM